MLPSWDRLLNRQSKFLHLLASIPTLVVSTCKLRIDQLRVTFTLQNEFQPWKVCCCILCQPIASSISASPICFLKLLLPRVLFGTLYDFILYFEPIPSKHVPIRNEKLRPLVVLIEVHAHHQ